MRLLGCAMALVAGCAGEKDPTDTGAGDGEFEAIRDEILVPSCGLDTCHGTAQTGLVVSAEMTREDLVNASSSLNPLTRLVIPGDPDNSYLVRKLEGGPSIQGEAMPPTGPLDPAEIQRIRDWIAAGAK